MQLKRTEFINKRFFKKNRKYFTAILKSLQANQILITCEGADKILFAANVSWPCFE